MPLHETAVFLLRFCLSQIVVILMNECRLHSLRSSEHACVVRSVRPSFPFSILLSEITLLSKQKYEWFLFFIRLIVLRLEHVGKHGTHSH